MEPESSFVEQLSQRGISRRKFLKFSALMTATLALPTRYITQIAQALATATRPPLIWLEFQDCTGDTESFLRASQPTVDSLLLDTLSVDYHETLMTPSGRMAEKSQQDTIQNYKGRYICVVEGSIPTRDGGIYTTIGGRTALSIAREACGNALATIAVGTCAWEGGLAAASPNPTGAVGVKDAVPGLSNLINLPGCPMNVANFTATIVHYLTFNQWPATDGSGRPLFAYGDEIHENCERHQHYEAERFVLAWGDEGHKKGWCLFRMGCKGPETQQNCPSVKWNTGTNWCIGAGHGCIGCSEARFWDRMTPFYRALPDD
jgi:hydrogenase small subunit